MKTGKYSFERGIIALHLVKNTIIGRLKLTVFLTIDR